MDATQIIEDRNNLRLLLQTVIAKRNDDAGAQESWVALWEQRLNAVGVMSVKDYVRSVMVLNKKSVDAGYREMDEFIKETVFNEACDMLFGPVGRVEGPDEWVEAGRAENLE